MYEELFKYLSVTGFLSIAFASGILWNKVQNIRENLDDFAEGCEKRHKNDKEVLETLAVLTSKVEILTEAYGQFRSEFNSLFTKKIRNESH